MMLRTISNVGSLLGLAAIAVACSTNDPAPSGGNGGAAGTGGQQPTGTGGGAGTGGQQPTGTGGGAGTGGSGTGGAGTGGSGTGGTGGSAGSAGSGGAGSAGSGGTSAGSGGSAGATAADSGAGTGGAAGSAGNADASASSDGARESSTSSDAAADTRREGPDSGVMPPAGDGGAPVPSGGCTQMRKLKDGRNTIQSGGMARTYYLQAPANYDGTHPYRLVFTFHWNGGSANSIVNPPDQDHNTDRPFYGLSDLSGDSTIYVAPDGLNQGWSNPQDRDVNFTDDMLKAISDDLCIDTSRVFTTGFSFGGAISYKLACVRTEKFRAAIVYDAGPVSGNKMEECTKPIAWFQSHGAADGIFSYSSVGMPILNLFVKLNGCTTAMPPNPPTNGHTCFSFEGCSAGHPTRWCGFGSGENNTRSPGGHYPSAKDPGETTSWIPTEAWKFITQF
jgi:poly(3-hydroxybutyrate) depolymerase